ncbi:discoidin domain-containing protein [Allohahella sp. A8]|uniref:galactose-binding domain-containing protein n=1 Tax=Allohahella sp. A8 TaxID=3141461 RepID=UPI003A809A39
MRLIPIVLATLSLTACGGGSGGSSGDGTIGTKTTEAVATGPVATATYDNDSAAVVIDGNTQPDMFWSGNITDDAVTVDLGSLQSINQLNVYTNNTGFSTTQPNLVIEVSADAQSWSRTADLTGGDVPCSSLQLSGGTFRCTFGSTQTIRYARVRVTATENIGLYQVYEVEAVQ